MRQPCAPSARPTERLARASARGARAARACVRRDGPASFPEPPMLVERPSASPRKPRTSGRSRKSAAHAARYLGPDAAPNPRERARARGGHPRQCEPRTGCTSRPALDRRVGCLPRGRRCSAGRPGPMVDSNWARLGVASSIGVFKRGAGNLGPTSEVWGARNLVGIGHEFRRRWTPMRKTQRQPQRHTWHLR